jgi:opacity protein-like surface antigen
MLDLASAVLAVAMGAAAQPGAAVQPITLHVERQGDVHVLRVVADSPVACTATYRLEVAAAGGGNRSVNRGTVTIQPSKPQTLATVTLGGPAPPSARLEVDPCGAASYEQVWPTSG